MRNRFYNNVSRPGSYGFVPHDVVTASMVPLGRSRSGVRGLRGGLGDCNDVGAATAVGIIGAAANIGGALLSAGGRATVSDTGAKSGGSTAMADAGTAVGAAGSAIADVWAAACLTAERGESTGSAPTESMDAVLERARATWAAEADSERNAEALEDARAEREEARAAAAASSRNLYIGLGIAAVVGVGAVVLLRK